MKYLGVDFGSKKIGFSISDASGSMAFPLSVMPNSYKVYEKIAQLCKEENIEGVVFGLSKNSDGEENKIMTEANSVVCELKKICEIPIFMQEESFTSAHARMLPNFHGSSKRNPARKRGARSFSGKIDDSAAALILQRFLDTNSPIKPLL